MNPAIHGAIAARKRQQEQEEEEQKMTQYNAEDLNGWEFKIVRSAFGRFRNAEVIRQLVEEEARNGWELVEKFDDCRIRFKRRTDKRGLHSGDGADPYRTNYGTNQKVLPLIAGAIALLLAITLFLIQGKGAERAEQAPIIFIAISIVLVAVAVVFLILRRK